MRRERVCSRLGKGRSCFKEELCSPHETVVTLPLKHRSQIMQYCTKIEVLSITKTLDQNEDNNCLDGTCLASNLKEKVQVALHC